MPSPSAPTLGPESATGRVPAFPRKGSFEGREVVVLGSDHQASERLLRVAAADDGMDALLDATPEMFDSRLHVDERDRVSGDA